MMWCFADRRDEESGFDEAFQRVGLPVHLPVEGWQYVAVHRRAHSCRCKCCGTGYASCSALAALISLAMGRVTVLRVVASSSQQKDACAALDVLGCTSVIAFTAVSMQAPCCLYALLQMKDFALRGYKSATSLSFHKAPNSAVGRVMGLLYR